MGWGGVGWGGGEGNLFCPTSEICDTSLEPDQISHTQSMVAKRGHTNRSYSYAKRSFKTINLRA